MTSMTLSNGLKSYVSRMRNNVAKESSKVAKCPKCRRERKFKFFGVRTHKGADGKPARFSRQSYCVDCRSGKVVKVKRS